MHALIVQPRKSGRFGRSATLALTLALTGCDAQVLLGSMMSETDPGDGGAVAKPPNLDASADADGAPPGSADASVPPGDARDTAADGRETPDDIGSRTDVAPPSDGAPPNDAAPPDDVATPSDAPTISDTIINDRAPTDDAPADGATCPSSARAPVQCVGPDASLPETPIESCPTASRTLLQHPLKIDYLEADAQGLYWRSSDGGLRILRTGEAAPQLLAFIGAQPFAIDPDALYFGTEADGGPMDLLKIKRDGTGLAFIASGAASGSRIALGPDRVYFEPVNGGLASTSKVGSGSILTLVARSVDNIVTDLTHVYWRENSSDASTATTSTIWRAPHGSTATELVATGLAIREFWAEGDSLVVLSDELGASGEHLASSFLEVPKTGGCPRVLVALPAARFAPRITKVALDDRAIYWTSILPNVEFAVWYAPRSGGIAVKVSGASLDENLALTATQAFWANWTIPPVTMGALPAKTEVTMIQVMDRP